jgi:pyruvate dehydrogenase E2 component (dihydrolipoamide acetyltransferase)
MAKILEMPKLSPTMEEGVLAAWHKKEGDAIAVDDLLAEVETDKATMEFRAFDKGTLLKLLVSSGSKVLLGQPVAIVGEPGEDVSAVASGATAAGAAAPSPEPKADAAPPQAPTLPASTRVAPPVVLPTLVPAPQSKRKVASGSPLDRTARDAPDGPRANGDRVMASPYVRKAARERGIDLQGAVGTGPGGRVVASDLEGMRSEATPRGDASLARSPARPESRLREPEVRPLSMMRKTIARTPRCSLCGVNRSTVSSSRRAPPKRTARAPPKKSARSRCRSTISS